MLGPPSASTEGADGEPSRRYRQLAGRHRPPRSIRETSAGGLVIDRLDGASQAVLIGRVDRRGRCEWVLPKGHIEPDETPEEAAVREVREETGLDAQVVSALGPIEYWFRVDGRRMHKTVHHYLLVATGGTLGTTETEVADVAWVPLDELPGRLRYASERRVVGRVRDVIRDAGAQ
ncbi:MAG: NUDIX hydrolase [Jiangellaceae bacterium]|nr:NUDIX hydrolase [Jiangellaceae bacterium]